MYFECNSKMICFTETSKNNEKHLKTFKNILTKEEGNKYNIIIEKKGIEMLMPKLIMVDSELAKEAMCVLDGVGIELDTVIKMMLKRIVREKDIAFLTAKTDVMSGGGQKMVVSDVEDDKMVKSRAVSLFESQGIRLNRNTTFASKNRSAYNYWANPNFSVLEMDWNLILNDWTRKRLYLFRIPAGAIRSNDLVRRVDQPDKIDLQICYNDPNYTDNRSKVSFAKYLVKESQY